MSSNVIKSHDHTLKINFTIPTPLEFSTDSQTHMLETSIIDLFDSSGIGLLKLTSYENEVCLESVLGDFNVAADEDNIFIQNVPNGIMPETGLMPLRLKVIGHSIEELNGYFDIQLMSKTTSVIDPSNFDYTYTIPEDFSTNIANELCSLTLVDTVVEDSYLKKEYQYSQDNIVWTDFEDLNLLETKETEYEDDCEGECSECEITLDPDKPVYLRILYTRNYLDVSKSIVLKSLTLNGTHEVKIKRVGELSSLEKAGECMELVQTDIYKVFSLTNYTIDSVPTDLSGVDIRFQISQDNCRTWSEWCYLTLENLKAYKVDPLRFFHIKYSFCLPETYTGEVVKIYDVILEGSVQNVSSNYLNGGKLGLRPEIAGKSAQQGVTLQNGGANYCETFNNEKIASTKLGSNNGDLNISEADPNALWNPYETSVSTELYNNMSNIVSDIYGFNVTYFPVNPDSNGIDRVIHEYQLYNVDECSDVKVMVPNNQFPDNQIKFTAFDLELFETFEIHITKDAFKSAFGIESRPRKQDFLFFPETNRMYEIEHAQANKDFLNSSTFYRVTLKKYNTKMNVKMSDSVQSAVDSLTNNNSLDSLFGIEKAKEDKITNKDQYQTLSDDLVRLKINKDITIYEEDLYNASLVLSKTHYDFSELKYLEEAINYAKADTVLLKSDNRAFSCWINFSELENMHKDILDTDYIYNIFDNYDETNSLGYKIYYKDKKIHYQLNDNTYILNTLTIEKDVWYCLVINLKQCDKLLDIHLMKRFTTITDGIESSGRELSSSRLNVLYTKTFDIEPVEFNISLEANILASKLRLTNIRLYNENIKDKKFTKVLNQYIIKKSHALIFADNANEKIIAQNHA